MFFFEAVEAYATAKTGKSVYQDISAHDNNPNPGSSAAVQTVKGNVLTVTTRMRGLDGTYRISATLDGGVKGDVATSNITKVTYKPDKQK